MEQESANQSLFQQANKLFAGECHFVAGAAKEEVAEVIQIAMALSAGACIAHRDIALTVEPKK